MEASKEELEALLARVEGATGPDREIDLALMILGWGGPRERYLTDELDRLAFGEQRKFTASFDAALALVERVGWRLWTIDASIRGRFSVMLASIAMRTRPDESGVDYTGIAYERGSSHTIPLALLAALLRAKAKDAQQERSPQAVSTKD